jgi:hypothetical protein
VCQHLQDRKQLYRVGEVAQAAWYADREQLFILNVISIEKYGEDIKIWKAEYD